MKRSLLVILTVMCWANSFAQISDLKLPYEHYRLSNGVEVVLQPDESVEHVSVEFWLRDGISIDKPDQYGLQHFLEHVMPYSPMDSVKRVQFFNKYLKGSNAQVKKDFSRFYLRVTPEGVPLAMERASGRLKAGAYRITERHVEYQRERVLAEIQRNSKNPHWSAEGGMAIYKGTFGEGHPYGSGGYGLVEHNKWFGLQDFRKRYNEIVYAENIILFVVGNFDESEVRTLINRHFGSIHSKSKTEKRVKRPMHSSTQITMKALHPKDTLNTMVFSWAVPEWDSEEDIALGLTAKILEQRVKKDGDFSKLFVRSSIYTDMYAHAGQFAARFHFARASDSMKVNELLMEHMRRLVKEEVTEEELLNAKLAVMADIKDMQQNLGFQWSRTELLGESVLFKGSPEAYFDKLKKQQSLSRKKIHKVAKKWLKSAPFRVLFVQ